MDEKIKVYYQKGNIKITPYALELKKRLKAKDKEFINILNDLQDDVDALQIHRANLDECEKVDVWELIEEIKQKIMKNE